MVILRDVAEVPAGSVWRGPVHGSRWMAFTGAAAGVVDLWCMDPGSAPHLRPGQLSVGRPWWHVREWLDPES